MSGPPVSAMSRRSKHLAIAATVFLAEVLVATTFARVGFVRSYLSDFLAVVFLYHLAKTVRDFPARPLAVGVFAVATIIEIAQAFHLADALGFRRGSLPSILLGTHFSWLDLLMYALGCLTCVLADSASSASANHNSRR